MVYLEQIESFIVGTPLLTIVGLILGFAYTVLTLREMSLPFDRWKEKEIAEEGMSQKSKYNEQRREERRNMPILIHWNVSASS
jgi:hypothetical protein